MLAVHKAGAPLRPEEDNRPGPGGLDTNTGPPFTPTGNPKTQASLPAALSVLRMAFWRVFILREMAAHSLCLQALCLKAVPAKRSIVSGRGGCDSAPNRGPPESL